MKPRRGASIRFWLTGLFVVVIVVAILILSGSLSAGLKTTLAEQAAQAEYRNASSLARRMRVGTQGGSLDATAVAGVIDEHLGIYGGGVWLYSPNGGLLTSAFRRAPREHVLASAMNAARRGRSPRAVADLTHDGFAVAGAVVRDTTGSPTAIIVTARPVDESLAVLDAARTRLWITFWISLAIAGLLGFAFAELIRGRVTAMSQAAADIAAGDFAGRVPVGFVPDEIRDLGVSYNSMAVKLGEAFGSLEESRRQIAAVVESMAEGVVAFDARGIARVINAEAAVLLDVDPAESLGVAAEDLTESDEAVRIVKAGLDRQRATGMVALGASTVLLHCTPLTGKDDEVEGAVLLLSDITERVRIEEAQRRFIADASHELRTPIAALKGMLELLADGAADNTEVRDDFIRTMQLETDRLSRLVADLLTLARFEAGTIELKESPLAVSDVLDGVSGVMATLAEQAGVRLVLEMPSGEMRVRADQDRLVQVLLGFTDNAIKHSPVGSTVRLRAELDSGSVRFTVSDEGSGIDTEEAERVFERFYRADSARGGSGTGLGLAIAKEIVEAHGSSIHVRSAEGRGTSFSFELPALTQP